MDKKKVVTIGIIFIAIFFIFTVLNNYSTLFGKNKEKENEVVADVIVTKENEDNIKVENIQGEKEDKTNDITTDENGIGLFYGKTEISDNMECAELMISLDKSITIISKNDAENINQSLKNFVVENSVLNGKLSSYTTNEVKEIKQDDDNVYYTTGKINDMQFLVICPSTVMDGKDVFSDKLGTTNKAMEIGGSILGIIGNTMKENANNNSESSINNNILGIIGNVITGVSDSINQTTENNNDIFEQYNNWHGTVITVYIQTDGNSDKIDKMIKVIEALAS